MDEDRRTVAWAEAEWLNPPEAVAEDGADLLVTARSGSDFWRVTSYGFVRDSGHALLTPFPAGSSVEVCFVPEFVELYDQAGLLVRVDERNWIKAGVEMSDGLPQLGAVVTRDSSDWSLAPVPEWLGRPVTIRASRAGDAVTVRARCADEPWRMIRLARIDPDAEVTVGPFCCAPERSGLTVRFRGFSFGPADRSLHGI
jgi:regulation of enolase protein 1 (concanavalin A-like superfamily)